MSLKPQLLATWSGELGPSQLLPKWVTLGLVCVGGVVAASQRGADPGEVGLGVAGGIELIGVRRRNFPGDIAEAELLSAAESVTA